MAKYNTEDRRDLAKKGHALPDGSFPIADVEDLKSAISNWALGRNPQVAKAFIVKRARALNAYDTLPEKWRARLEHQEGGDMADQNDDVADFLEHFGVKGMRWGVRTATSNLGAVTRTGIAADKAIVGGAAKAYRTVTTPHRAVARAAASTGKAAVQRGVANNKAALRTGIAADKAIAGGVARGARGVVRTGIAADKAIAGGAVKTYKTLTGPQRALVSKGASAAARSIKNAKDQPIGLTIGTAALTVGASAAYLLIRTRGAGVAASALTRTVRAIA